MILEYGGKNCWCYKDWLEVNLRINKNVPEEYGFPDVRVVPFLCFEGANGSGKTSALRVLGFITNFAAFSFSNNPDSDINFRTFFDNDDHAEFYLHFALPTDINTEYRYKLKVSKQNVESESLYVVQGTKQHTLLKRLKNKFTVNELFENSNRCVLRSNVSMISTIKQYGISEINAFYSVFATANIELLDLYNNPSYSQLIARTYYLDKELLSKAVGVLKTFDTGVEDISIEKYMLQDKKEIYIPVVKHLTEDGPKPLIMDDESTGTQALFNSLLNIFYVIKNGGVLVWDEMDAHLHSKIANEIIGIFNDYSMNTTHAQLIFTSHCSDLLDITKKYRSYLLEKKMCESYAYRIDEIKDKDLLRNDKPLAPIYKSGIIGGQPNVSKS